MSDCSASRSNDDDDTDCKLQLVDRVCGMPAGTLANGASCRFDQQCQSNFCFSNSGWNQCGVCTAFATVGTTCVQTAVNEPPVICVPGSICDDTMAGGSNACIALGGPGDSCAPNGCYPITSTCSGGSCVALTSPIGRAVEGDRCDLSRDCAPGLVCDIHCQQPQILGLGQGCGHPSELCNDSLCLNLCNGMPCTGPDQSSAAFVCASYTADGDACAGTGECDVLASCVAGSCELDPAACK